MQIVFESAASGPSRVFIVKVISIDETEMTAIHKGRERTFKLSDVAQPVTVSGRPFSLRTFPSTRIKWSA